MKTKHSFYHVPTPLLGNLVFPHFGKEKASDGRVGVCPQLLSLKGVTST